MLSVAIVSWLLVASPAARAPYVDEAFASASLGRTMAYRVLLPPDYNSASNTSYRVLYLLHGLGGGYLDWSTRTDLATFARALPLIVVMPEGDNSWYTNAAQDGPRFEDYIADDLILDVERKYRVIRTNGGRAIAGLSMGGYGALKIALKHSGSYAAAGSFSGAFPITDPGYADLFPSERDHIERIFGPPGDPTRAANDIFSIAERAPTAAAPPLYFDTGTTDRIALAGSRRLAEILQRRGYRYEFHEVPGGHSWEYWNRSLRRFLPWLMDVFAQPAQ